MINKTYLHLIRTSNYSNSASSCHVFTCPRRSNKNSPHSKLKHPSRNIFQLPHPTVLNIFKLPSTGSKKWIKKVYVQIRVPHSLMVKF